MRHPLIPITALVALVILVCEGFFGAFTKWSDPSRSPSHYSHFANDECWMRVYISDIPVERDKTFRVTAEVLEVTDSNGIPHSCNGKMLIYIEKPAMVTAGDELLIRAAPRLPSGADNPHQFDYRRHLQRRGILYTTFIHNSSYKILEHSERGFKARITSLRKRFIDIIHFSSLTPSQQGIAEALILGWDGDLDGNTEENFRSAGIAHLLCVSGLHVGIIAMLVGWCLFFFSNRRTPRIIKGIIQIIAIWAFVAITGTAPSAMRAGLMFTLIVIGQMFFTKPPTLNTVAASALILLVANPLLLFEIGFQLSYASIFAIILFTRPLENLIPIPDSDRRTLNLLFVLLKKIRTLFCVCLSAQLAVTPLILFYFHTFPPYFLVANMTIVPCAALLLGSTLLMLAVCWWPFAFKVAGYLVSTLLSVTERITSGIASWPNAMLEDIYFDGAMLILALTIITLLGFTLIKHRWSSATAALTVMLALVAYAQHIEAQCSTQQHCDIYRVGNRTAMEFFTEHQSILLCDSVTAAHPEEIDYQTANNLVWHKAKRNRILTLDDDYEDCHLLVRDRFIGFNGKTFRIIDRSNYRQQSHCHIKLDYLLLRESPYTTISELSKQYEFDTLVIASQNSTRRRMAWQQECDSLGIPYIE